MNWDFTKLPKEEYDNAIDAYNVMDIISLIKLHNKYKLSQYNYCCNPDEAMMLWWGHAINNKLIYETRKT